MLRVRRLSGLIERGRLFRMHCNGAEFSILTGLNANRSSLRFLVYDDAQPWISGGGTLTVLTDPPVTAPVLTSVEDDVFLAHAWVEYEGIVLNDRDDIGERFAAFEQDFSSPGIIWT